MKKSMTVLLCILLAPVLSHAANSMRDGLWEITSTMEMPGTNMKIPPTVVKHCYSKADVVDQKKIIAREKNCSVTDMKTTGNKVSWAMVCTGRNACSMTGETVFGTDSYTTVMHMKTQGHSMNMKAKAKYLGNCK